MDFKNYKITVPANILNNYISEVVTLVKTNGYDELKKLHYIHSITREFFLEKDTIGMIDIIIKDTNVYLEAEISIQNLLEIAGFKEKDDGQNELFSNFYGKDIKYKSSSVDKTKDFIEKYGKCIESLIKDQSNKINIEKLKL